MVTGENSSDRLVKDRVFDLSDSVRCSLFVKLSPRAIQFCIHDPERDAIVVVGQYKLTDQISDVLDADDGLLRNEFRKGTIAVHGFQSMLIPESLAESAPACLSSNFGVEIETATTFAVPELEALVATAQPQSQLDPWLELFPYLKGENSVALNLELMRRKHKFSKSHAVYVDVSDDTTDVYVWNGPTLQLYNAYQTESNNDVLYHVVNVIQQLDVDLESTNINFSGQLTHADDLDNLLRKYLPKMTISPGLQHVKLALGLSKVRKQHYATLFNQVSCGL